MSFSGWIILFKHVLLLYQTIWVPKFIRFTRCRLWQLTLSVILSRPLIVSDVCVLSFWLVRELLTTAF